jgi:hypothetical protein
MPKNANLSNRSAQHLHKHQYRFLIQFGLFVKTHHHHYNVVSGRKTHFI